MRRTLLLMFLLLLPTVAALDLQVQLEAPARILPGEAANITVSATLDGVPIISFPANATITYPDGTVMPLQLTNSFQGYYTATVYSVMEGTHVIQVTVPIDDMNGSAKAIIVVEKPSAGVSIAAQVQQGQLNGTLQQDSASDYKVEVAPFSTGDLNQLQYAPLCSFSCGQQCEFSCPTALQSGIAKFTTEKGYTYTYYVPFGNGKPDINVTYDATSGTGEPLTITTSSPAGVYALFGNLLMQVALNGDSYSFVPQNPAEGTVLVLSGDQMASYPVKIIERTNVAQFVPSSANGLSSLWWYGFVQASEETLLRLPADPGMREAYLLSGNNRTKLGWEKGYVVVPPGAGWVEVRRAQPALAQATQNSTDYGMLVGGAGLQRHELSGTIQAFDTTLAPIPVYSNGSTSVFYTQNTYAAVVQNTEGTLAITQPLKTNEEGAVQYSVNDSSAEVTFSIYRIDGTLMQRLLFSGSSGTRQLLFSLPSGQYLAVAQGENKSIAASLLIYSENASITISDAQAMSAAKNSEVHITHTITNNDLLSSHTVELSVNGTFTAIINATDSDSDGLVDVTLAPGETKAFSTTVFIPPDGESGQLTFNATAGEMHASVIDTLSVESAPPLTYVDADVVSIEGTKEQPVAIIQNNHDGELAATLYITGPAFSTQITTLLEPGLNNVTLPDSGVSITVRLQATGDTKPENNEHTRHFLAPFSPRLVHINERMHADHSRYTVQIPSTPGYTLVWIDDEGGEHKASAMDLGDYTLWDLGAVPANHEFYAALLPGEPSFENMTTVLDNSNPAVTKKGAWISSITTPGYVGFDYLLDLNIDKNAAVIYAVSAGKDLYSMQIHTPPDASFATNVPVTIHGETSTTVLVNEQKGGWQYLGLYSLDTNSSVVVENARTTQFVAADAIAFTPISQIGGLVFAGNSSVKLSSTVGRAVSIGTASYLESVDRIDTPQAVSVTMEGATAKLQANSEGDYTVVFYDNERSLTVQLHATLPKFEANFTTFLSTPQGPVQATLYADNELQPIIDLAVASGNYTDVGESAGWLFDAEMELGGKQVTLQRAYLPGFKLPLTITEANESHSGKYSVLESYTMQPNGLKAASITIDDVADGTMLMVCQPKKNSKCRWQANQQLMLGQKYTVQLPLQDVTLGEVYPVEQYKAKQGKKEGRGRNWERQEKNGRGTLTISTAPQFAEQPDGFVPIDTDFVLADGTTAIDTPQAAVTVKDNLFTTNAKLQSGDDMISITEPKSTARISLPQRGIQGKVVKNRVLYENIMPSTDVAYDVKPGALQELYILHGQGAPRTYKTSLTVPNSELQETPESYVIRDNATDEALWVVWKPFAYDEGGKNDTSGHRTKLQTEVTKSGDTYTFTTQMDEAWFTDPSRQFPIIIDPTIVSGALNGNDGGYVSTDAPAFYDDDYVVGEFNGANLMANGFVRILMGSSLPPTAIITDANFSVTVQTNSGWDAGADTTYFGFLNSTQADTFWNDNFRQSSEYLQTALSDDKFASTTSGAGTLLLTVNSTGIASLQKILVDSKQNYVTIRSSYDPAQEADHQINNEYLSFYTGINCCGVSGTVVAPQLNVSYVYENDTPIFTNPGFNQTSYNTTQAVYFGVNVTDATSGIDTAIMTMKDPASTSANYTLSNTQSGSVKNSTVSTATQTITAQNRTTYLFFDDFSMTSGTRPLNYLWAGSGQSGNDWDVNGGRMHIDRATLNPPNTDTVAFGITTPLNNQDGATLTYDWETSFIEAPDSLNLEFYNGTAWNSIVSFTTASSTGSRTENISGQYLTQDFSARYSYNGDAANDDVYVDNVNLTSWKADNNYNGSWVQYDDISSSALRNLSLITVSVQVSNYRPNGSVNRSNTRPDLELQVFNGSDWISAGTFNLSGVYTGNGQNNTPYNFSASTSNSATLAAWQQSKYYRDIRIRPVYMDYASSTATDMINYTAVYLSVTHTGTDTFDYTWGAENLTMLGLYNATQIFANDTINNTNTTSYTTLTFTLYSLAEVSARAIPGGLPSYPQDVDFTCTVTDQVFGTPIANYNVTITSNITGTIGTYNTNSSGQVGITHTVNNIEKLTCIISNRTDLFYYAIVPTDFRIVAVDTEAPQWSLWSLGNVNSADLSDGFSVNRTNTTIQARSYWTDNIGMADAFIEHNGSGTRANHTVFGFSIGSTATWINKTFDFSDSDTFSQVGLINVTAMYGLDFVPNVNNTSPAKYFYLYGRANISSIAISPSSPSVLEPTVASCTLLDWYDLPVLGYNVSFYRDSTLLGSALTDSFGVAQVSFNTASVGAYTVTCNITDSATDYYTLGSTTTKSNAMVVNPDSKAPVINALGTIPTTGTLGESLTVNSSLYDVAGITSAYANITLPSGSTASSALSGSGTSYSGSYVSSQEGLHWLRATATDPSSNTNVSAYTHFTIAGKAATSIATVVTRVDSNTDLDLVGAATQASADLEAGTQSFTPTITVVQMTNISAYFSSSGSCTGVSRNDGPASNSCRRAGYFSPTLGKRWGASTMRSGYEGTAAVPNEAVPAWMFDLSGVPDDAALTGGYMSVKVASQNAVDAADTYKVLVHPTSADSVWDSNGPEQSQLQSLTTEFQVGTISGATIQALGTANFTLTQTQLDSIEGHLASNAMTLTIRPNSGVGSNEYVNFETGFNGSSTSLDPELSLNYTTPTIDYNGSTVSYGDVLAGAQTGITAIRINVTLSGTDFRGSNSSVFTYGKGSMPVLRVNVWNGSEYKQKYACDILQRGIGLNTTAGTCSIAIRDSDILSAWQTATNRDLQLQAMYLDSRNEGTDTINWTGVTAETFNGSVLLNTAPASLSGNVTLSVERNESGSWVYNSTIYNASQVLSAGQYLNLSTLWNPAFWNTGDRAEGTYRAVVRLINSTGSVVSQGDGGNVEAFYTFTINDTVKPSITNLLPMNLSTLWGLNSSGIVFGFNATDATGFTNCSILLNNVVKNTTTSVQSGVPVNLTVYSIAQGSYQWDVGCYDNATARNYNASVNWTLYIDNTAPTVTILTLNESNFSQQTVNVTVNISDNNWTNLNWRSFVDTVLNNSGSTTNASVFNITFSALPEGRHNITIEGKDGTLISANSTILITIDLTPPSPFINTSSNTFYNTTTPTINLTIYDNLSTLINYTFYINNVANVSNTTSNASFKQQNLSQVPEGNHTIILQATDQAGNSRNSTAINIIVDMTAPSVFLLTPPEGYNTTNTSNNFTWNYSDIFSSTANCTLRIDGAANTTAIATNTTPALANASGFTEGRHNWTVTCTDLAGNTGAALQTRNFTVDRTAPTVNLITPANATTYTTTRNATFTYNVTDVLTTLSSCDLYVNNVFNQTRSNPLNNTNYNFNISDVDNGAYQWSVTCNDTAGNRGFSQNRTVLINITADAQSPAANSRVDRDGTDATDPDVIMLTVNLSDGRSGANVTFKGNLTNPVIGGQTDIVFGNNTTNATGYAVLYWNPNSTVYAGNWTWWGEESRSLTNTSLPALVYGSTNITYLYATIEPNSEYNASQQVRASYNVSGYAVETPSVLNSTYGMTLAINFTQPNGTVNAVSAARYNSSSWNTTYTLASNAEIGSWTVSAATNGTWFYTNLTSGRVFTVKGLANAISPSNGSIVDRDGLSTIDPAVIPLVVQIPGATQTFAVNFTANLTDPVIGGQTNIVFGNNTTNATGYAVLYWNPNSTVYAGNWTWWGISNVSYLNATANLIVKGSLDVAYKNATANPNSTYFINDTAIIQANISSYGPESTDNLSAPYTIIANNTLTNTTGSTITAALSYTSPYWNTTQVLLGLKGVGTWNTTANASGTYWYSNATNRTFVVYSYMNVTANTTSPSTIYAFQYTTTSCTVKDQFTDYPVNGANVTFYRNGAYVGYNTTNSSGQAQFAQQINATGTYTITCNVTSQPSIYYARGDDAERNSTVNVQAFSVAAIAPANGTLIDRDGVAADPDLAMLNASVPGWVPDGQTIEFYANLTNPVVSGQSEILLGSNTTNGSYAILWYNPGNTVYAGNYTWYANHTAGISNSTKTFEIKGGLIITYRNATANPNSTYFINDTAIIQANISSYGPESTDNLSAPYTIIANNTLTNTTGSTITAALSYTSPYWNTTQVLLGLKGVGTWNTSATAGGTDWYANTTNRTFAVYSYMNITANTTSPSTVYAFQYTTTSCTVKDQFTDYPVNGANVTFYRNGALLGSNNTSVTGSAQYNFQVNTTGTYTITCNVTDQPGIYYYRGDAPEGNSTITVTPFLLTPMSPANDSQVDRDGTNAGVSDVLLLNASTPSWVPDGVAVNFTANLTSPTVAGQADIMLGNNTTSAGYAVLYWNPNSTFYAGNYSWYPLASVGTNNGSRTAIVYGQLLITFENNSLNPNSSYYENDTLNVRVNVTSAGPESRDNISSLYTAVANFTVENTTGSTAVTAMSYTSPIWNGSYGLLGMKGVGSWAVSPSAGSSYFFNNSTTKNFTVYGYMNVTANTTSPSTIYAFQYTTTACTVKDQFTDYPVNGANVTFYRNGTYLGYNLTGATGNATFSSQINTTGLWTMTCNVSDQPSILYVRGDDPEHNSTVLVVPFKIDAAGPANGTVIDRDGVSADPDNVMLNATMESYVPDGVSIEFRANLTDPIIGGQTNILLGSNTTNGSYAVLWFNPNSSVYAGNWTWFGNHSDAVANSTRTVIIKGGLSLVFRNSTYQPNSTYNETQTVTAEGNLTSNGPETVDEMQAKYTAAVNSTFTRPDGMNANRSLSYTSPYWNTTFRILDVGGVGNWTAQLFGYAAYFYDMNSSNRSFLVYGLANATNMTLSSSTVYAFQSTTAQCAVINGVTGQAISGYAMQFYRNSTNVGNNTTNSTGQATYTFQTNASGVYDVNCTIANNLSAYYYASQTTSNTTLTVIRIPISTAGPANDTIIDRDSVAADPDSAVLNASVPSGIPDGVLIEFRANLTDPIIGGQTNILLGSNTTQGGFATFVFNPNNTIYAGNWTWFGVHAEGYPNDTRTVHVLGSYNATYENGALNPNSTYLMNDTIITSVNITSAGPETRSQLNGSYSASVNASMTNTSGSVGAVGLIFNGSQWVNNTFVPSTLKGAGVWNHNVSSGAQHFYSAADFNRTVTIYSLMNITTNTTSPALIYTFENATTTCNVKDQFTQYAVNNANVTFYRNGTYIGYNLTGATGNASLTYQVGTSGVYTITCNVTDQPGIYYYRGDAPEGNSTLTVVKFLIDAVSPANDTFIDRDEQNGSIGDSATLNATVPAFVPDGVQVAFYANLTAPFVAGKTNLLLGNNTTSGGSAVFSWNPNSTFYAGNYTWWATADEGAGNTSMRVAVLGQLVLDFWDNATPAFPDANYTENSTAAVRMNLTTYGPESADNISNVYAANVNVTFTAPSNSSATRNASYTSPYWNTTFRILDVGGVGIWNISVASDAQYFLSSIPTLPRNTTVYGYANLTEINITPNPIDAYNTALYQCSVQDEHTGTMASGVNVSFYFDGALIGSNVTNASGDAIAYRVESVQGLHEARCNITDDLAAYYYAGDAPWVNTTVNVTPILITPESPVNNTVIDRDQTGYGPNETTLVGRVLGTVPDGIVIDFWADLTDPVIGGQSGIYLGSNVTNGSYVNLTFNPNSTLYAGNYSWYMNSSGGATNGTNNIIVEGSVNITYADGSTDPLSEYNKTLLAYFTMNVTSLGPETNMQLNSTYGSVVNLTLTKPDGTPIIRIAPYNGSHWNTSYSLTGQPYGVWNTSAAINSSYFYPAVQQLRNFTIFETTNLTIFDDVDVTGMAMFANTYTRFYANYTNSSVEPVLGANCTLEFFNGPQATTYNATSGLYEFYAIFSLEGMLRYNATCTRPYHYDAFDSNNVSVYSIPDVTLDTNITDAGAGVKTVSLNVTNLQNYTEHDIWIYHFIPRNFGAQFGSYFVDTQAVNGGQFSGNTSRFYVPNLTAGQSIAVKYNVSGLANITDLYNPALQVYTENTSIVYE